jgi:hypothetical protein
MSELTLKLSFREYTFEQDKTDCRRCEPGRWLLIANYDLIYFPLRGETYMGIENAPLKVKVASYKNLKDAKRALHRGRFQGFNLKIEDIHD